MRNIRRAAVTGLFALWLAPLSAAAEAPSGAALRADRPAQAERAVVDSRRKQDDQWSEDETSFEM